MEVLFDPDKCTACGLCVQVCPARAMEICLDRDIKSLAA
jgi:ferredoxin